jgi:hypothetical protein
VEWLGLLGVLGFGFCSWKTRGEVSGIFFILTLFCGIVAVAAAL